MRLLLQYTINSIGIIVELRHAWIALGGNLEVGNLRAAIGTKLLDHVTGDETQHFVAGLLGKARASDAPFRLRYRCDAPNLKRFMEMTLSGESEGAVRIAHRVVRMEALNPAIKFEAAIGVSSVRCSMCNRVRHHGVWREAEDAMALNYLQREHANLVIYKVCSDCRETLGREIGSDGRNS